MKLTGSTFRTVKGFFLPKNQASASKTAEKDYQVSVVDVSTNNEPELVDIKNETDQVDIETKTYETPAQTKLREEIATAEITLARLIEARSQVYYWHMTMTIV